MLVQEDTGTVLYLFSHLYLFTDPHLYQFHIQLFEKRVSGPGSDTFRPLAAHNQVQ